MSTRTYGFCEPLYLIGLLLLVLGAAGCTSEEARDTPSEAPDSVLAEAPPSGTLDLRAAWARPAVQGGNGAVYLTLLNSTGVADTLRRATSPAADTVELHRMVEHADGMRGMRPVDSVVVAPGERLVLEQGGRHFMLVGLNRALQSGDTVSLTLDFAQSGARQIDVPVRTQPPGTE